MRIFCLSNYFDNGYLNVTFIAKLVKCDIVHSQKAQSCHLQLKEATAYIWEAKLIKDYGLSWTEMSEQFVNP